MHKIAKGIILGKIKKNTDNFIFILSNNNKIMKIFAPGVRKSTSKNKSSLLIFNEINFSFFKGKGVDGFSRLKTSNILNYYGWNLLEQDVILYMMPISKLLLNNNIDLSINAYSYLKEYIELILNTSDKNKLSIINIYFYLKFLHVANYRFNINSCANCNDKSNITSFSLQSGGLICIKCCHENSINKLPLDFIDIIMHILKSKKINDLHWQLITSKVSLWLKEEVINFYNNLGIFIRKQNLYIEQD